ncbi:head fiber protein [Microbispora sp. CA-102843]|uniref:head fiber protein n=1 Tax=Microbispora sp. CA-102843 TaxID=3239952 RepID=UPI003D8A41E1
MNDTPDGEVRNVAAAPAITVATDDGPQPLDDVLADLSSGDRLMAGAAETVADSTATDVDELVADFNTLLAALRTRGVIT